MPTHEHNVWYAPYMGVQHQYAPYARATLLDSVTHCVAQVWPAEGATLTPSEQAEARLEDWGSSAACLRECRSWAEQRMVAYGLSSPPVRHTPPTVVRLLPQGLEALDALRAPILSKTTYRLHVKVRFDDQRSQPRILQDDTQVAFYSTHEAATAALAQLGTLPGRRLWVAHNLGAAGEKGGEVVAIEGLYRVQSEEQRVPYVVTDSIEARSFAEREAAGDVKRQTTARYEVRLDIYLYNTGAADNGTVSVAVPCQNEPEAVAREAEARELLAKAGPHHSCGGYPRWARDEVDDRDGHLVAVNGAWRITAATLETRLSPPIFEDTSI